MIRLFIDSGTDRNDWLRENYDHDFLPLTIILGDKEYIDEKEVDLEQVYDYMKEGNFPKTSQVTPHQAYKAFKECAEKGEDVIYISLHKGLSGTYQAGLKGMQEVKKEFPEFKGTVINSNGACSGSTILFVQANELLKAGYSYEEVVEQLEWLSGHLEHHIIVDSLSWLAKGGRMPKSIGIVGTALKVKAYLGLDQEGVTKRGILRGKERAYKQVVKETIKNTENFKEQVITISYVGIPDEAQVVADEIHKQIPEAKIQLFELGPVLAAHVGVGALAVMYINEKPKHYILPQV